MSNREFFDVKVNVGRGYGVLSYYMTDNYQNLENYLKSKFDYNAPDIQYFHENKGLSKNVRKEMQKRECIYSMTVNEKNVVINFYDGNLPKIVVARHVEMQITKNGSTKRQAKVILCKCSHTIGHDNLFGVRVEKIGSEWIYTWAFKIDEARARHEGFDKEYVAVSYSS